MADVSRDPGSRQRRRKKRVSRDLEDQTNESLESPSSLPERIPLQEVIDGEKVAVPQSASNNSGEGSSGMQQSTADRRNRGRRPPRRRSRLENGDVYDGIEAHTSTLEMPEKKKYKRPASGVRHVRRSASAEMIDREDDDVRDSENVSPARRRPRRKKAHGSRDVINGEEYNDYDGYGEPTAETSRRSRPRKHKTKKTQRQQNGTSAEEDNYNADVDGEVSVVDFYKVDKEDIVSGEKPGTAPPALPPVAQTLPSQPLDVLFIERRDGHFLKRKAQLMQQDDRHEPHSVSTRGQMTTAEFAVNVHRAFRSFSLFCHGLLAGLALCQCIFVYSLSNSLRDNKSGDTIFLENYCKLAQPLQSLYYMLFAICTVSVFDRYDMANPRSGFFHGLLTRPSRILSISAYLFALVFSISVANIDDRISLYEVHGDLWGSEETSSLLETWRIINLMRVLGAVLGWVLVAVQPTKDYTAQNLYEGELLPGEERVIRHRPNNNGTQEAA